MAGETVVVACKMPNGLVLRLFRMVDEHEQVMGGGTRKTKRAERVGEEVTLNGSAFPFGAVPEHRIVGGYALTPDVPKDFFDAWMEQNKTSEIVKNELVFAFDKAGDAEAKAKENRKVRTGLEPVSPDNDPRLPRRVTSADEMKERQKAA